MKSKVKKNRLLSLLLALVMIAGFIGPVYWGGETVKAEELDAKLWAWPDDTNISGDVAVLNAGIQFIRMENNNQDMIIRMNYKAVVSPPTLHWIDMRFDPELSPLIEEITANKRTMENLAENPTVKDANDNPYRDTADAANIWRVPLDRIGKGVFTSAPVVTFNYLEDFTVRLKRPLTAEEMQKIYSVEMRIMGSDKRGYTISKRTMNNQVLIEPAQKPAEDAKGNWLKGSSIFATYESQATYTESFTGQDPVEKTAGPQSGILTFRYKYFSRHPYNTAAGGINGPRKPYEMMVRISKNAIEAMQGDVFYVQPRWAGTAFMRGISIPKDAFIAEDEGHYIYQIRKDKNQGIDTRDYLQPETDSTYPGITDIVIPINETALYDEALKKELVSAEIVFYGDNGVEVDSSRSQGYAIITETKPVKIQNIDKINGAHTADSNQAVYHTTGDEVLYANSDPELGPFVNVARLTQNSLRGVTERAGSKEIPDPNDSGGKSSIVTTVPTQIFVTKNNGDAVGDGKYEANEDGSFEITFDQTFEEMGLSEGDELTVYVYALAAGKTMSQAVNVRMLREATHTPEALTGEAEIYKSYTQIQGKTVRHEFKTNFTAELTLYKEGTEAAESATISGGDINVTPDGVLTVNIPENIKSAMQTGDEIRLVLKEESYDPAEEWTVSIVPDPADVSRTPVINGPVKNTDTTISGTGVPGAVINLSIPTDGAPLIVSTKVNPKGEWQIKAAEAGFDLTGQSDKQITASQKELLKDQVSEIVLATVNQDPHELQEIHGRYFVEVDFGVYRQTDIRNADALVPTDESYTLYVEHQNNVIRSGSKGLMPEDGDMTQLKEINIVPATGDYIFNAEKSTLPQDMDFSLEPELRVYDVYYDANLDAVFEVPVEIYYGEGDDLSNYVKNAADSAIQRIPKAFVYNLQEAEVMTLSPAPYYHYKTAGPEASEQLHNVSGERYTGWAFDENSVNPVLKLYFEKQTSAEPVISGPVTDLDRSITITGVEPGAELKLTINGQIIPSTAFTFNEDGTVTAELPEDVPLKDGYVLNVTAEEEGKAPSESAAETVTEADFNPDLVTDLTVSRLPEKIAYTDGESFDPAGMKVTLTDKNGKKKEISYEDFAANHISLPAEALDEANGNPQQVTVRYENGETSLSDTVQVAVVPKPESKTPIIDPVYDTDKKVTIRFEEAPAEGTEVRLKVPGKEDYLTAERDAENPDVFTIVLPDEVKLLAGSQIQALAAEPGCSEALSEPSEVLEKAFDPERVTKIVVSKQPGNSAYTDGDVFDPTGMEVTLIDENGKSKIVPYDQFDDNRISLPSGALDDAGGEKQTVEITYDADGKNLKDTVPVTVSAKPAGLKPVITQIYDTDKVVTITFEGDQMPEAGATVSLMVPGRNEPVPAAEDPENPGHYIINIPDDYVVPVDMQVIALSSEPGKAPAFSDPVKVKEKPFDPEQVVSLAVTRQPDKNSYLDGTAFDPRGTEVTLKDSNGKTKTVAYEDFKANNLSIPAKKLEFKNGKKQDIPLQYRKGDTALDAVIAVSVNPKPLSLKPAVSEIKDTDNALTVTFAETPAEGTTVTLNIPGYTEPLPAFADPENPSVYTAELPDNVVLKPGTEVVATALEPNKSPSLSAPRAITEAPFNIDEITNIQVTKAPDTKNYTDGDVFDPKGMVVTLTDRFGKTLDVPYEAFGDYGLTVPEDVLIEGQKDIVVTYDPKPELTSDTPIKVKAKEVSAAPQIDPVFAGDTEVRIKVPAPDNTKVTLTIGERDYEARVENGEAVFENIDPPIADSDVVRVAVAEEGKQESVSIAPVMSKSTLSYNANGVAAEMPPSFTGKPGTVVNLPAPENTNEKIFVGWGETPAAEQALIGYKLKTGDTTLYALWKDSEAAKYTKATEQITKEIDESISREEVLAAVRELPAGAKVSYEESALPSTDTPGDYSIPAKISFVDGSYKNVEIPVKVLAATVTPVVVEPLHHGSTLVNVKVADEDIDAITSATLSIMVRSSEDGELSETYYNSRPKNIEPEDMRDGVSINLQWPLKVGDEVIAVMKDTGKAKAKSAFVTVKALPGSISAKQQNKTIEGVTEAGAEVTFEQGSFTKTVRAGEDGRFTLSEEDFAALEDGPVTISAQKEGSAIAPVSVSVKKTPPAVPALEAPTMRDKHLTISNISEDAVEMKVSFGDNLQVKLKKKDGVWTSENPLFKAVNTTDEADNPVIKLAVLNPESRNGETVKVVVRDAFDNRSENQTVIAIDELLKPVLRRTTEDGENPINMEISSIDPDADQLIISSLGKDGKYREAVLQKGLDEHGQVKWDTLDPNFPVTWELDEESGDTVTITIYPKEVPQRIMQDTDVFIRAKKGSWQKDSNNVRYDIVAPGLPVLEKPKADQSEIKVTLPPDAEAGDVLSVKVNGSEPGISYTVTEEDLKSTPSILTIPLGEALNEGDTVRIQLTDTNGNATDPLEQNAVGKSEAPVNVKASKTEDGYVVDGSLEGSAAPGAVIRLKDKNGKTIAVATADSDGKFSVPVPGEHAKDKATLKVTAQEEGRDESEATTLKLDITPPALPAADPIKDGDESIKIKVPADDASEIRLTFPGQEEAPVIAKKEDGVWTVNGTALETEDGKLIIPTAAPVAAADGSIKLEVSDPTGNTASKDLLPREISGTAENLKLKKTGDDYVIKGTAPSKALVQLKDENGNPIGQPVQADAEGNFTLPIPTNYATDGRKLNVTAKEANKLAGAPAEITVDAAAPDTPVITAPTLNDPVIKINKPDATAEKITLTIDTEPESKIVLTKDEDGNWVTEDPNYTLTKDPETGDLILTPEDPEALDGKSIVAVAEDAVGNVSDESEAATAHTVFDSDNIQTVEIKSGPNKTNYTEGEKFDPSGMEVTLTDQFGNKKTVSAEDFAENNIRLNPDPATALTTADDGKKVTVTAGTKSAQSEEAITVAERPTSAAPQNVKQEGESLTAELPTPVTDGTTVTLCDEDGNPITGKDGNPITGTIDPETGKVTIPLDQLPDDVSNVKIKTEEPGKKPSMTDAVSLDFTAPDTPVITAPTLNDPVIKINKPDATAEKITLTIDTEPESKIVLTKDDDGNWVTEDPNYTLTEDPETGDLILTPEDPEALDGKSIVAVAEDAVGNVSDESDPKTAHTVFDSDNIQTVEIKSGPNKTNYTEGEKFDPSGMEVTLTDQYGNKKTVSAEDFAENNISLNPDPATALTTADDGKKVTVTAGTGEGSKSSQSEEAITVAERPTSAAPQNVKQEGESLTAELPTPVTDGTTVTLCDEDGNPITGKDGNPITGTIDPETGKVTIPLDQLPDDVNTVKIKTEEPGKKPSMTDNVSLDFTAPDTPVITAPTLNDPAIKINKPDETAEKITLTIDTEPESKIVLTKDEDGNWVNEDPNYTLTKDPETGDLILTPEDPEALDGKSIVAVAEDAVGNVSDESDPKTAHTVFDSDNIQTVEIKSGPNKTAYTEGDSFDPSGMEVTLTDQYGNKKTVSAEDFAENNIRLNPDPASELTTADDGKKVTVTAGTGEGSKSSQSEEAITVAERPTSAAPQNVKQESESLTAELPTPVTDGTTVTLCDEDGNPITGKDGNPITGTIDPETGKVTIPLDQLPDDVSNVKIKTEEPGKKPSMTDNVSLDFTAPDTPVITAPTLNDPVIKINKPDETAEKITLTIDTEPESKIVLTKDEDGNWVTEDPNYTLTKDPETGDLVLTPEDPEALDSKSIVAVAEDAVGNVSDESDPKTAHTVFDSDNIQTVEIKSGPNKTNYTEGEKFDPSGMEVTLTDQYGNKKTVSAEDFAENNISLNPDPATALTTADDGKKVTVTAGTGEGSKSSQSEEAITVAERPTSAAPQNVKQEGESLTAELPTPVEDGTTVTLCDEDGNPITGKDGNPITGTIDPETGKVTIPLDQLPDDVSNVKIKTEEPGKKPSMTDNVSLDFTAPEKPVLTAPTLNDPVIKINKPDETAEKITLTIDTEPESKIVLTKDDDGNWVTEDPNYTLTKDSETGDLILTPEDPEALDGKSIVAVAEDAVGNVSDESDPKTAHTVFDSDNIQTVEIKSGPNKTNYTEGEKFDPSGMEVTLTDQFGNKKTVSAEDFAENNIRLNPDPATALTTADDGKKVAVTAGTGEGSKSSQSEEAITVNERPTTAVPRAAEGIKTELNESLDPRDLIANADEMPEGTRYSYKTSPDFSETGELTVIVSVQKPNEDAVDVTVTLEVVDSRTDAEKFDPVLSAEKVKVKDTSSLTPEEKAKVKEALIAANPDLPKGTADDPEKETEITVADDGSAVLTYPDGSKASVRSEDLTVLKELAKAALVDSTSQIAEPDNVSGLITLNDSVLPENMTYSLPVWNGKTEDYHKITIPLQYKDQALQWEVRSPIVSAENSHRLQTDGFIIHAESGKVFTADEIIAATQVVTNEAEPSPVNAPDYYNVYIRTQNGVYELDELNALIQELKAAKTPPATSTFVNVIYEPIADTAGGGNALSGISRSANTAESSITDSTTSEAAESTAAEEILVTTVTSAADETDVTTTAAPSDTSEITAASSEATAAQAADETVSEMTTGTFSENEVLTGSSESQHQGPAGSLKKWFTPLQTATNLRTLDIDVPILILTDPETEPSETDPTETEPSETDPTETEPSETDPTETEPSETDPTETEPSETDPTETEPIETDPTETEPSETDPTETEPSETDPTETEPIETDPTETEPTETEPTETEPIETDPTETEPSETDKVKAEPQDLTIEAGQPIDPESAISNLSELPEGTRVELKGQMPDTSAAGTYELELLVTYPDGRTEVLRVNVTVKAGSDAPSQSVTSTEKTEDVSKTGERSHALPLLTLGMLTAAAVIVRIILKRKEREDLI